MVSVCILGSLLALYFCLLGTAYLLNREKYQTAMILSKQFREERAKIRKKDKEEEECEILDDYREVCHYIFPPHDPRFSKQKDHFSSQSTECSFEDDWAMEDMEKAE